MADIPPKPVRLAEFFRRLENAPCASDFQTARDLVTSLLNAVEDEWTGIPYDPRAWRTDGRMYPPLDDHVGDEPGRSDVKRLVSRRQNTLIRDNGAIRVIDRVTRAILLDKPGLDGRSLDDE